MPRNPVLTLSNGHTDSVLALSLSDRLLASGGEDGNLCVWSPSQSSSPVFSASLPEPCASVKFSKDSSHTIYSAHGRRTYSWDSRHLRNPLKAWEVSEDEICCLDLLKGEPYLAVSDDSGAVQLLCTETGNVVRSLKKHDNICSAVRFRPNRPHELVSGGLDCRLIVSDWRGTGLGVAIFEMAEIIDNNLSEEMANILTVSGGGDQTSRNRGMNGGYASDFLSEDEAESDDEYEEDVKTEEEDEVDTIDPDLGGINTTEIAPSIQTVDDLLGSGGDDQESEVEEEDDDEQRVAANSQYEFPSSRRRIHDSLLTDETGVTPLANAWTVGLPFNPPMVHSVTCTPSGALVAAGLESGTVEVFSGTGKRLRHIHSLYGHRLGVSSLLCIGESHLVSGGNDMNLFVWPFASSEEIAYRYYFGAKVDAIEGDHLNSVYVTDTSPNIQVMDLTAQ